MWYNGNHTKQAAREGIGIHRRKLFVAMLFSLLLGGMLLGSLQVTAHRGSSGRAPENTLASIQAAIEDQADIVEIDVQQTADGVVVLLHDVSLEKTTGDPRNVWEVPFEEVEKLDAGSWFSETFAGEKIPTLQQALQLARGKVQLNVELKVNGNNPELAAAVVEEIRGEQMESACLISSSNYEVLLQVRQLAPAIPIGFILHFPLFQMAKLQVDFFSVKASLLSPGLRDVFRNMGKPVHVWTVNATEQMQTFQEMGVEGIITNEPAKLRALLQDAEENPQP